MESNMTKQDIKNIIELLRTDACNERAGQLMQKLDAMPDEKFKSLMEEQHIYTEEDVRRKLHTMLYDTKFKPLNDIVSFGRSEKTIHIHVVPTDARHLLTKEGFRKAELALIDALEQIKEKMNSEEQYKDVKSVYAVSALIKRPISRWFEGLDFDVKSMSIEEAKNDDELSKFYDRFKDKKNLGRAELTREMLFSEDWEKRKEERKGKLLQPTKKDKNLLDSAVEATEEITQISSIEKNKKTLDKFIEEKQITTEEIEKR